MTEYQQLARETEQLKIETSAVAGFAGIDMVLRSDYCRNHQLKPENILHILWTTGGRYLPE